MHKVWLAAAATLSLAACNDTVEPGATPGTPAPMATTNAKVEPVPTETVKPASNPPAGTPGGADSADATGDACGALKVAQFIGRQDRPTTRADLIKAVGHDRIRWIGPDDVVTMDFNPERLNVLLDEAKRLIKGARCG